MTTSMRNQRGLGLIGGLFLIAIAGFVLTVAFKLGPHYMDYLTVRSVMRSLTEDPSVAKEGKMGISNMLQSRLYINSVRGIGIRDFKFRKTKAGYLLSVHYQVQEHLIANVDVLLTFSHEVKIE